MDTVLCSLMAATSTLTVLCLRISATTDGSMNVRFASAAEDSRNVSEDLVLFDSARREKNIWSEINLRHFCLFDNFISRKNFYIVRQAIQIPTLKVCSAGTFPSRCGRLKERV